MLTYMLTLWSKSLLIHIPVLRTLILTKYIWLLSIFNFILCICIICLIKVWYQYTCIRLFFNKIFFCNCTFLVLICYRNIYNCVGWCLWISENYLCNHFLKLNLYETWQFGNDLVNFLEKLVAMFYF